MALMLATGHVQQPWMWLRKGHAARLKACQAAPSAKGCSICAGWLLTRGMLMYIGWGICTCFLMGFELSTLQGVVPQVGY